MTKAMAQEKVKKSVLLGYLVEQGWDCFFYGAEGVYLDKGPYRIQLIEQDEKNPSVHNSNNRIPGTQNMLIFMKDGFATIFFGYCDNEMEFNLIVNILKLKF